MHPVEIYARDVAQLHKSGAAVPETSYYPALKALFDAVGEGLKPKVACIVTPANRGAGVPDAGFFLLNQRSQEENIDLSAGGNPERGVCELKGLDADVDAVAESEQVRRYADHYGQVLVSNLWDFLLVDRRRGALERFRLAESKDEFLRKAAHPRALAKEQGDRLCDYLRRILLRPAPITDPQDLAGLMAAYAREALSRVESCKLPALAKLREALEKALGVHFQDAEGEHFFRSTLVQTLFYGLFSAWVAWARDLDSEDAYSRFDWRTASWSLHVPMINSLFVQITDPATLRPLGMEDVLDWTGQALQRVERDGFFDKFVEERAVQYFYEPFLQAYDPELRKELGVWYTPPEVVAYMVERVDRVLREELDLSAGLADPRVHVLDPCCGTGAYLVEVLDRIARTLEEQGDEGLVGARVKEAAVTRVFGFEILPAPYVVAHLQLGLILKRWGAPLKIDPAMENGAERAAVYLTNALTGWEPPEGPKEQLFLPALERERDAAEEVKQSKPILVVLGNPPYNAFAGVSPEEEKGLVQPYKEGLIADWGIKKFNLDDLYVRFFRLAERRIAEMSGRGVVCYVSNFSYLGDPSFVVMRQRLLHGFNRFWVDCLNGDSRQTGKLTPEGKPDPSIFSTEYNREGIRVGAAVGLMVKHGAEAEGPPRVLFRHLWGANKRAELTASLNVHDFNGQYDQANPLPQNRYTFRPMREVGEYLHWPKLTDLCQEPLSNGLMEKRGGALISVSRKDLENRMRLYFDRHTTWEDLEALGTGLTKNAAGFDAKKTRNKVLSAEPFHQERIRPYMIRPFDERCCYYCLVNPLWNRPRPSLWAQCWEGNAFLLSRVATTRRPEGVPFSFSSELVDDHYLTPDASAFPLRLRITDRAFGGGLNDQHTLGAESDVERVVANLSAPVRSHLEVLGFDDPDNDPDQSSLIWMHALAIGFSPAYLNEHGDAIRADWPRIPLPAARELLEASAELGRRLAELLDSQSPAPGVTAGDILPIYRTIASVTAVSGEQLDPNAGHLDLTVGWGYSGSRGVTMPGKGRLVRREYSHEERAAIEQTAAKLGMDSEEAYARLGETTCDVYLNDNAYWRNVPEGVWEFYVGGYQVLKKWLSYREKPLLGRGLTLDEAGHAAKTARRLAAIRLLEPKLDANYAAVKAHVFPWPA
jgi:hypothetical protein